MIQVNVNNNDTADIFVSMVDNNTQPPAQVMNSQRLNAQSAAVQVSLQEDGNGSGNVTWTAVRCADSTISKQETDTPANLDTVQVSAL